MFSNIFRIIETRSFKPLKFTKINAEYIDNDVEDIGIYIHIPFCKKLCSFCPYNKVKYDEALSLRFKDALLKEIHLIGDYYKEKNITSIYFGGGTPSLMLEELNDIIIALKEIFNINCDIGIELHPSDITKELAKKLKDIGFTMVSIGIQSFQQKELITLGREFIDGDEKVTILKNENFKVIDVDLIFGINGQSIEDLKKDFITAFENGATQVSTYPFIDFSYANNKNKPLGRKEKKVLLNSLETLREELNLKRTSVWTFGKEAVPKYSSITRDAYIGFGPSAASLTKKYFKINTFSVEEYISALNNDKNPKSLTMDFTERLRALYWCFWNAYTLEFNNHNFRKIFKKDIESIFKIELLLSRILGIIKKTKNGYKLTELGIYLYHLVEQHYTHQYIDKTWRICGQISWPDEIDLY
ncbi:MAG: radical SAM protein [Clostridioides difficile]|nr:radical SAM protein [Clostridioides sp.]MBS5787160.1 radical SAM protein [Clostridioides difficile]